MVRPPRDRVRLLMRRPAAYPLTGRRIFCRGGCLTRPACRPVLSEPYMGAVRGVPCAFRPNSRTTPPHRGSSVIVVFPFFCRTKAPSAPDAARVDGESERAAAARSNTEDAGIRDPRSRTAHHG